MKKKVKIESLQDTSDMNMTTKIMIFHNVYYFLFENLKTQVYKNNPHSMSELKDQIIHAFDEVEPKCP